MKRLIVLFIALAFLSMGSMCHHNGSHNSSGNKLPIGSFDNATKRIASGWAYDSDAGKNPVLVHVYVDNKIHCITVANKSRGDVIPVVGDAYHGWECDISKLGLGTHVIKAYAINFPAGINPELGGSPKTIEVIGTTGIWKEITGGQLYTVGESLFHMKEFSVDHKLYGATESSGKIVRFNGIAWDVVFNTEQKGHGRWVNSYHLGEHGSFLYTGFRNFFDTPTSIRVYRTNGEVWSHVHQEIDAQQCRFVDDFHGDFLTILSSYSGNWTKIFKKTDPNSQDIGQLVKTYNAFFYGDNLVHNGILYVGGNGIYKIDASFNISKVHNIGDLNTITSFQIFNDAVHATMIQGWRATSGSGLLYKENNNGIWNIVKYFPEPEAWCQEVFLGDLYVGTRLEGGGGKVYQLDTDYKSKVVGTTLADGFFSLRKYKGKLFAGTYSMERVRSYIYF